MVARNSTLSVIFHVHFYLIHNTQSYEIITVDEDDYVRLWLTIVRKHIFKTVLYKEVIC